MEREMKLIYKLAEKELQLADAGGLENNGKLFEEREQIKQDILNLYGLPNTIANCKILIFKMVLDINEFITIHNRLNEATKEYINSSEKQ